MNPRSRRDGWQWRLPGAVLWLLVVLTPGASLAANLTVDGGATYTVAGNITYDYEYVGDSSTGTVNQGNFTNTANNALFLGNNAGSSGTYNLSGGSFVSGSDQIIGSYGSGTFNQSGGTDTVTNVLSLGYFSGGSGTYNLSNTGILGAGAEIVGLNGTGAFIQTGGSNTVSGPNPNDGILYLGANANATGTYTLSGTGSLAAGKEIIGNFGSGTFNQSGGTHTVSGPNPGDGRLVLGYNSGASGTYNLIDGSLSAGNALVGGTGEYIGYSGSGVFTQNGGTNTVARDLFLGWNATGSGTYTLNAGSLSAANEVIG